MLSSPGARRGSWAASVGPGGGDTFRLRWAGRRDHAAPWIRSAGGAHRSARVALAAAGDCRWPARGRMMHFEPTWEVVDDPLAVESALWKSVRYPRQELREATDLEGCARRPDRPTGRGLSDAGRRAPCSTRLALQCGPPQGSLRGSWRCPDPTSGMLRSGTCMDCPARPSAGGGAGSAQRSDHG
jgi:hypothetical protein